MRNFCFRVCSEQKRVTRCQALNSAAYVGERLVDVGCLLIVLSGEEFVFKKGYLVHCCLWQSVTVY